MNSRYQKAQSNYASHRISRQSSWGAISSKSVILSGIFFVVAQLFGPITCRQTHRRRVRRTLHLVFSLLVIASMLVSPFADPSSLQAAVAESAVADSSVVGQDSTSPKAAGQDSFVPNSSVTPTTSAPTFTSTSTSTSISTSTATSTITRTRIIESPPPPTYTIGVPTLAPTVTPIPTTSIEQQGIDALRANLLAQVSALPALTGTLTGTLVSGLTGGRITSADQGLTLGMQPGVVPLTDTINVQVQRVTFSLGDPRRTRGGEPLAYTYALTATRAIGGQLVEHFDKEVALVWRIDPGALAQAGVKGFPYHVYTYNEQNGQWQRILSHWNPATNQLIATTPHFSLYAVGTGFEEVNNYVPSVNNFETDLQSGTSSVQYPMDLPQGPGGFGPKVSLSYNSGNTDRVDFTQQGTSNVGWGWSLSTNYIAATQHFFPEGIRNPWTASIVVDGINGDLVKGTDGNWHTSNESFAKIMYHEGTGGNRTTDWWEAWGKDGTHYVFDLRALKCDYANGRSPDPGPTPECPHNSNADLTTYKWMLRTATDVYGNTITYSYQYEPHFTNATPVPTPIATDRTRAVYPYQIKYGGDDGTRGSKLLVEFQLAKNQNGSLKRREDISTNDGNGGAYQSFYINKVIVKRLMSNSTATVTPTPVTATPTPDASGYVTLRSYDFEQNYDIVLTLPTGTPTPGAQPPCQGETSWHCPHLTLSGITSTGNDGSTQLPKTSFEYIAPAGFNDPGVCATHGPLPATHDRGKLCWAHNGYGGAVGYFYDAAGGSVSQQYRRVREKQIKDGLGNSPPHTVSYRYFHRGATTNYIEISGEADALYPRHTKDAEFRGFAWVQVQSPLNQTAGQYHTSEHYFSQTDEFKGKQWRMQEGKGVYFVDPMTATPTQTPQPNWNVGGTVYLEEDPQEPGNYVWKLVPVPTSAQTPTPTPETYIERTTTITDGMDVALKVMIAGDDKDMDYNLESTWKMVRQVGAGTPTPTAPDYWGLKVGRKNIPRVTGSTPEYHAKIVWSKNGVYGERDLSTIAGFTPRRRGPLAMNQWYWLRLHTSPDGRFAVELYRPYQPSGSVDPLAQDYIMIKSGDDASSGGENGKIPLFGSEHFAGQSWKFRHDVGQQGGNTNFYVLDDEYSETRTIYSQSDTVYEDRTPVQASGYVNQNRVGLANNAGGMNIRFVPAVESWSILYGKAVDVGSDLMDYTSRRSRQLYAYDSYGNRTLVDDYGKVGDTADERSIRSVYATPAAGGRYIVDRVGQTETYRGITPWPPTGYIRMAQTRYYYDDLSDEGKHGQIPSGGKGELTKVEQAGVDPNSGAVTSSRIAQRFDYDGYGNRTHSYDANNNLTQTKYDTYYNSFPVEAIAANGRSEYTTWNYTVDMPNTTTDMNNVVTGYIYDQFGRPKSSWVGSLGDRDNPNDKYFFSDVGQTSVTPPFYISYQHRVGATQSEMAWQTRWYDGRGRTVQDVSPKDPSNNYVIVVDSVYTDTGQIYTTTLPYQATAAGPTATVIPATSQPRILNYYDGLGRITMSLNPDNSEVLNHYEFLLYTGTRDERALNEKWQHTDMQGRMDRAQERDFSDVRTPITTATNTPTSTPTGTVQVLDVTYTYDALDRLKNAVRDPGETTQGHLNVTATTYYDDLGRKSSMNDPDMGTWHYRYDAAGNLIEQRDALCPDPNSGNCADPNHENHKHQIFFTYDSMNRIKAKYYGKRHYNPPSTVIPDVKYYYDNDLGDANNTSVRSWGRLRNAEVTLQGQGASKANGHGYQYNERGLPAQEVITTTNTYTSRPYTIGYSYDAGGRPSTVSYPNPGTPEVATTTYNTQGMGLPVNLSSSLGGPMPVRSATYNTRGQLQQLIQGTNGPYTDNLFSDYTYDDNSTKRGWLKQVVVSASDGKGGSAEHLDLSMDYTLNGNVEQVRQTATDGTNNPTFTNSYQYDGFNRLTRAFSTNQSIFPEEVYSFNNTSGQLDGLSRMFSRTIGGTPHYYAYAYNDNNGKPDAPTSYGANGSTIGYGYDANGNQITRIITSTNSTQTRSFDPENRIGSIQEGSTTTTMVYDANGVRLIKSVTQNNVTSRTLYIGSLYEEELTGATNQPYTNYYTFGGKLAGMRKGNQPDPDDDRQLRVVGDHLGSTTLVIDTSTSSGPQVIHRQYYKPYGEITWTHGTTQTSIGYTGQRLDSDSGLMYYGARFYDPVLSYFVSADPVDPGKIDPKSRERYSYALYNPLRYTDATGLTPEDSMNLSVVFGDTFQGADLSQLLADTAYHYVAQGRGDTDWEECKRYRRWGACVAEFANLGIIIEKFTDVDELIAILEGIHALMAKAGWNYTHFKRAMGIEAGGKVIFSRFHGDAPFRSNVAADAYTDPELNPFVPRTQRVTFYDKAFQAGIFGTAAQTTAKITVHELAHVWDYVSGGKESQDFVNATGGTYIYAFPSGSRAGGWHYTPGGTTAGGYAPTNPGEDWAESVAAAVYPEAFERAYPGYQRYPVMNPRTGETVIQGWQARANYVHQRFASIRK